MAKIISRETLEELAKEIAKLHKPIMFNWPAKFGLSDLTPASIVSKLAPQQAGQPSLEPEMPIPASSTAPSTKEARPTGKTLKPKKKLICNSCGEAVAYNVAKFCWFNKKKFGENIYCMDCQKKV